VNSQDKEV